MQKNKKGTRQLIVHTTCNDSHKMPQEVDAMPFSQSVSEQGPKEAFVGAD
jgi:hypothetical protein